MLFSQKSVSPRKEILHNIDPLYDPAGVPKYNGTFKTSTRAALRVGDWKIITGEPGKSCNVFTHLYVQINNFLCIKLLIFSYLSVLMYVLGLQKNRLIETVLLSTHNICLVEK